MMCRVCLWMNIYVGERLLTTVGGTIFIIICFAYFEKRSRLVSVVDCSVALNAARVDVQTQTICVFVKQQPLLVH